MAHPRPRLLLIEGGAADAATVLQSVALVAPGMDVHCVDSLDAGGRAVSSQSHDVVLIDLDLEEGSLEAVSALARHSVPIVAVSRDEELATRALQLGAQDFVNKQDLTPCLLVHAIRSSVMRHRAGGGITDPEELRRLAFTDPLTGLLNRRAIAHRMAVELGTPTQADGDLAAMLLDLDRFKPINDQYGHDVGDDVLRGAARAIVGAVRAIDHVARVGGDEFLVLLPNLRAGFAEVVAERVRIAIQQVEVRGLQGLVTASVGMSPKVRASDLRELISQLDEGLRRAKGGGRNRVCVAGVEQSRAALGAAALVPYVQPMIRLRDGTRMGTELVARGSVGGLSVPESLGDPYLPPAVRHYLCLARMRCIRGVAAPAGSDAYRLYPVHPSTILRVGPVELGNWLIADAALPIALVDVAHLPTDADRMAAFLEVLGHAGAGLGLSGALRSQPTLEALATTRPEVVVIHRAVAHRMDAVEDLRFLVRVCRRAQIPVICAHSRDASSHVRLRELGLDAVILDGLPN